LTGPLQTAIASARSKLTALDGHRMGRRWRRWRRSIPTLIPT